MKSILDWTQQPPLPTAPRRAGRLPGRGTSRAAAGREGLGSRAATTRIGPPAACGPTGPSAFPGAPALSRPAGCGRGPRVPGPGGVGTRWRVMFECMSVLLHDGCNWSLSDWAKCCACPSLPKVTWSPSGETREEVKSQEQVKGLGEMLCMSLLLAGNRRRSARVTDRWPRRGGIGLFRTRDCQRCLCVI